MGIQKLLRISIAIACLALFAPGQDRPAQQPSERQAGPVAVPTGQLTPLELNEAEKWARQVQQAKSEFEQAQAALYGSAVYQQFEAARARYNLAVKSQENAFNVACGEHGIKPSECETTPDGKGLKRKEPPAPAPAK